MAPRLPELVKRARRLAHERDRLVADLAREWSRGAARPGPHAARPRRAVGGPDRGGGAAAAGRSRVAARSEAMRVEAHEVITRVRERVEGELAIEGRARAAPARGAALRALPSVDARARAPRRRDAALADVPRARACRGGARGRSTASAAALLGGRRPPGDAAAVAERAAAGGARRGGLFSLAPRHQRHRRRAAHQPGPRAAVAAGPGAAARRRPARYSNLELDLERKERGSRYSHVRGLLRRLTGAPGRAGREQQRGRRAPRARDAGPGQGGDRLARRADRDRRRVPHPRHHAPLGRACCARSARPTARTSRTTRGAIGPEPRYPEGARVELSRGRLHRRRVRCASWRSWGARAACR